MSQKMYKSNKSISKDNSKEINMLKTSNYFEAYAFYKAYILDPYQVKLDFREDYQFKTATVSSGDWELFGAILTGQSKSVDTYGHDLRDFEVKSARDRSAFEYQYHRNTGEAKLASEPSIGHMFISYDNDYRDIDVRIIKGEKLKRLFESWLPGLQKAYGEGNAQRYRMNVPYQTVVQLGEIVFQIRNGKVIKPTFQIALEE